MTQKEYKNNLYDQLSIIERIENVLKNKDKDENAALNEIQTIKNEILRKLR